MKLNDTRRKAQVDAITARCNSGAKLRIYAGSVPANANASVSGNTLLAEFTLSSTGFGAATGTGSATATATANSIADVTAAATGTATFARQFESDGSTVVGDLTLSDNAGSGEVKFANPAAFATGVTCSITSYTLNMVA